MRDYACARWFSAVGTCNLQRSTAGPWDKAKNLPARKIGVSVYSARNHLAVLEAEDQPESIAGQQAGGRP